MGNDISFKSRKMYIAFVRRSAFIYINFKKFHLTIHIKMKEGSLIDPKNITRDVSNVGRKGHGYYEIKLTDSTDMGYIMTLIKQSYDKN